MENIEPNENKLNRTRTFKINDYLILRLENSKTVIYIKEKKFRQCMYLLVNVPLNHMTSIEDLKSIDESEIIMDSSRSGVQISEQEPTISPEVEFWGHCSLLQVWYENGYNTGLIPSKLAFPLLRALVDAGDPRAQRVFADEIARRFDSGYPPVMLYLIENDYLSYLTPQQIESLNYTKQLRIPDSTRIPDSLNVLDGEDRIWVLRYFLDYFSPQTAKDYISKVQILKMFRMENQIARCFENALKIFPDNEELIFFYKRHLREKIPEQNKVNSLGLPNEIFEDFMKKWKTKDRPND